ncbi:TetR family transcriptional regulator [Actinomadura verrucosospora]|uniref:TetR family transcriptional regulator n=1 Tax=Actinomadura verrucosospora TaxID=46165 RepID=A0A7D4APQ0_ACTVE|nr:TetR family transcriptional regulator [Actinomadura verrucosospora]QKG23628.1 TetR family transcriptional regulator [Actinomadura verrucosospora]
MDQDGTPRSLTERRKAATQLDIARAAAELFADKGPDATTAEEIAGRAGVALRTFYRYFRNKQDAVGPLLSTGGDRWRALLAETDPDMGLARALESAAVASLSAGDATAGEGLRWTRGLLRAAQDDPALRAVWCQVNADSEEKLLPVLGRLAGPDADPLEIRLVAAAATSAIRVSLEAWATAEPAESPAELVVRCLRELTGGLSLLAAQR